KDDPPEAVSATLSSRGPGAGTDRGKNTSASSEPASAEALADGSSSSSVRRSAESMYLGLSPTSRLPGESPAEPEPGAEGSDSESLPACGREECGRSPGRSASGDPEASSDATKRFSFP